MSKKNKQTADTQNVPDLFIPKTETKHNTFNGHLLIASFGVIGVAMTCVLLIIINNLLYYNTVTFHFVLYSTLYAIPFVIVVGITDRALVRRFGNTKFMQKNELLGTIYIILITWILAIVLITMAFVLFEPEGQNALHDLFSLTPFWVTFIVGPFVNILIILLSKFIEKENLNQERQKRLEEMEAQITQIKYHQLQAQVNPHFLFNSLNVLTSLINKDQAAAANYTRQLAQIYRYFLTNEQQDLVSLQQEIDFARKYAHILSIRYTGGLEVIIPQIDNAEIKNSYIVPTAIQILIENAVKHNASSVQKTLKVEISYTRNSVSVKNNLNPRIQKADSTGIGLKGLAQKYNLLTGSAIHVEKTERDFIVTIPLIQSDYMNNPK